jgi:hypothetical protein
MEWKVLAEGHERPESGGAIKPISHPKKASTLLLFGPAVAKSLKQKVEEIPPK